MRSIELFAGAGGLAMGMARAGFEHAAVVEWDADACQTIRENLSQYAGHGSDNFKLHEGDAKDFLYANYADDVEFISGGPPCQPFSLGGKHRGFTDSRDMFPVAVQSIREIAPKAFVFENVKGLLRKSFASYLEYVILQLTYPSIAKHEGETWEQHLGRLERTHTAGVIPAEYHVVFRLLNAANYGVPQKRERVFIVGFRADLGVEWAFPDETHSEDQLLVSKWVTGDYWTRHGVTKRARPQPSPRILLRIARLKVQENLKNIAPWVTVRDAIGDLPDPERKSKHNFAHHVFNAGARTYPGHTGSPLDEPAKTLKAGDHGVPGGENMLVRIDGSVRYFTVREAARLQTFPDDYAFHGSWGEIMRQLGNAVPMKLGEVVGRSVYEALKNINC